jgi:branched-chain amino acid transport system permease protein
MRIFKIVGLLVLLACVLVFPLVFSNSFVTSIAVFTLLFAGAATGWNIFSGYTGYINLGNATYYGIGAYTLAIACQGWNIPGGYMPFLLFPLSGLIAGLCAIPLGWVALRTRRHVFVVVTIALFYILQLLAYNLRGITNGSEGIFMPIPPWLGDYLNIPFYYVGLAMFLLALAVSWWVRHSKFGLGLLAIRDDEDHALGLGVKTGLFKLAAYVISAIFAGMAGALYAYFVGNIYPQFTFDPVFDVTMAMTSILGGLGTLAGPVIGAILFVPFQQLVTIQFGASGLDLIMFGAIFLLTLLILPEGIVPSLKKWWRIARAARQARLKSALTANQERTVLVKKGEG